MILLAQTLSPYQHLLVSHYPVLGVTGWPLDRSRLPQTVPPSDPLYFPFYFLQGCDPLCHYSNPAAMKRPFQLQFGPFITLALTPWTISVDTRDEIAHSARKAVPSLSYHPHTANSTQVNCNTGLSDVLHHFVTLYIVQLCCGRFTIRVLSHLYLVTSGRRG